ncbi:hypothetical protein HII31_13341 [Pseudocercospora fuligena]|uniref:Zn(2)-C6 fungal-type domain-containing protein n=1 Tax=Pseudocercospora fuligena TaxID=685502 RepID=A0A8H6R7R0_9PEZI|nr:hypothetical protein HII31_13341 [Pseudocercospora fuligena]
MTDNPYFAQWSYQTYPPQNQWQQPTPAEYWTPATTLPPQDYSGPLRQPYIAPPTAQLFPKPPSDETKPSMSISPICEGTSIKQKKSRAVQACEQCRYRKQRCDEGQPCSFCRENDLQCHYRPTMPTKNDKVIEFLLSWMTTHADGLQMLKDKFDSLENYMKTTTSRSVNSDALSYLARTNNLRLGSRNVAGKTKVVSERDSRSCIILWPEIRKILSLSGAELTDDYVVKAEDRPVLNSCFTRQERQNPTSDSFNIHEFDSQGLDLSRSTINRLLDAYLVNIHQLHPFLNKRKLVMLVNKFIDRYGSNWVVGSRSGAHLEPPIKRRRIDDPFERHIARRIERSPANALVLLVLALGAASSPHRERLQTFSTSEIPPAGLKYFAQATSIAAEHFDGYEIIHAHIFLLAGLYKARQGRVSECGSWYSSAARVLLYLVQRHDLISLYDEATTLPRGSFTPEHDSILTATWVCLFLENDILPELRLPPSGIQRLQESLPLPTWLSGPQANISMEISSDDEGAFLAAQIGLQRIFQQILRLSDGDSLEQDPAELNSAIKCQASSLQEWRNTLPSQLRWDDRDSPPVSCLHARLRYRYWEAKLRILRSFLDYILHIQPGVKHGMTLEACSKDARGRPRPVNERQLLGAIQTMAARAGGGEVLRTAELCVEAAKQCVLICKNVASNPAGPGSVAIAHSQFHNTLMLVAVSRCAKLKHTMSVDMLPMYFAASMTFLANLATISPVCAADYKALSSVQHTILGSQGVS